MTGDIHKAKIINTINSSQKSKWKSEHWDEFIILPEKTKLEIFGILEEKWHKEEQEKMAYIKNLLENQVKWKDKENIIFHPKWEIHIYKNGREQKRAKWLDSENIKSVLNTALLWNIDILLDDLEKHLMDLIINEKVKRDLNTKENINKSIINFILDRAKTSETFKNIDTTLIERTIQQAVRESLYDKIIERIQNIAIDIIENVYKDLNKSVSKYIKFINFYWKPHLINEERKQSSHIISWWIIKIKSAIIEYYKTTLISIKKQEEKIKSFEDKIKNLNDEKIWLELEQTELTKTYEFLKKENDYIYKKVRRHEITKLTRLQTATKEEKDELISLTKEIWILKDKLNLDESRKYEAKASEITKILDVNIFNKRKEIKEIEEKINQNLKNIKTLQARLDEYREKNDNIKDYNTIILNLAQLLLNPFSNEKK